MTPWDDCLDRMVTEAVDGDARNQVYWAQQLAFSPVFPYALALRLRDPAWPADTATRDAVGQVMDLALEALGSLPEASPGVDATALALLARRQAEALAVGRRSLLSRLMVRLGRPRAEPPTAPVRARLVRPYPLLAWKAPRSPVPPIT